MLNVESFRDYCLQKPGVTEGSPFDDKALVFKAVKVFDLVVVDTIELINPKCDPLLVHHLREQYDGVRPGYHMSKMHWNSVYTDAGISDQLILGWVDDSYDLIVKSLNKKQREEFNALSSFR